MNMARRCFCGARPARSRKKDPSGRDIDAEHGSGGAGLERSEFESVTTIAVGGDERRLASLSQNYISEKRK